jgi:hypothetical protein
MTDSFVPIDFNVPQSFHGTGFRLEPLGAHHNDRDYEAWMTSIEHIHATPGFPDGDWPSPMSSEANLADLVRHAGDFEGRKGFTYSVLDGDEVIGCVYIYPSSDPDHDADVSSWVRESRADMDEVVWRELSAWLNDSWPFTDPKYDPRG